MLNALRFCLRVVTAALIAAAQELTVKSSLPLDDKLNRRLTSAERNGVASERAVKWSSSIQITGKAKLSVNS